MKNIDYTANVTQGWKNEIKYLETFAKFSTLTQEMKTHILTRIWTLNDLIRQYEAVQS